MKRAVLVTLVVALLLGSLVVAVYSNVTFQVQPPGGSTDVEIGYVSTLNQLLIFGKDNCKFSERNPAASNDIINRRNADSDYQTLVGAQLLNAPQSPDTSQFPQDSLSDVFLAVCDLSHLQGGKKSNIAVVSQSYIIRTGDSNVPLKKFTIDYAYEYNANPVTDVQVEKIVFGSRSNLVGYREAIPGGVDNTVFFIESFLITPYTHQPFLRWYFWWYDSHHHPNWYYGWWYWHWYWWWSWHPRIWPWWWTWWWSWYYGRYWYYWSANWFF